MEDYKVLTKKQVERANGYGRAEQQLLPGAFVPYPCLVVCVGDDRICGGINRRAREVLCKITRNGLHFCGYLL